MTPTNNSPYSTHHKYGCLLSCTTIGCCEVWVAQVWLSMVLVKDVVLKNMYYLPQPAIPIHGHNLWMVLVLKSETNCLLMVDHPSSPFPWAWGRSWHWLLRSGHITIYSERKRHRNQFTYLTDNGALSHLSGRFFPGWGQAEHSTMYSPSFDVNTPSGSWPQPAHFESLRCHQIQTASKSWS